MAGALRMRPRIRFRPLPVRRAPPGSTRTPAPTASERHIREIVTTRRGLLAPSPPRRRRTRRRGRVLKLTSMRSSSTPGLSSGCVSNAAHDTDNPASPPAACQSMRERMTGSYLPLAQTGRKPKPNPYLRQPTSGSAVNRLCLDAGRHARLLPRKQPGAFLDSRADWRILLASRS